MGMYIVSNSPVHLRVKQQEDFAGAVKFWCLISLQPVSPLYMPVQLCVR